ncbi:MAG: proprotein convertase P-domain-containing protein [Myxococcota bacterium]
MTPQDACNAADAVDTNPFPGDTDGASSQDNVFAGSCVGSAAREQVVIYTPLYTGQLRITLDSTDDVADLGLYVRTTCDDSSTQIACEDSWPASDLEVVTVSAEAGVPLAVFVDGYSALDAGAFTLDFEPLEDCANGSDDNGDTLVDCADPTCAGDVACAEDCSNGSDDNGDTLVDCADPTCTGDPACVEDCTNGSDDNGDTLVDCADPQCDGTAACVEDCTNGTDDNRDTLVDCDDPQCSATAQCASLDKCDGAFPAVLGDNAGNNTGATDLFDGTAGACFQSNAGEDLWTYTPTADGLLVITLTDNSAPPGVDHVLYVRGSCLDAAAEVCADDGFASDGESMTLAVTAGTPLLIFVDGFGSGAEGAYTLNLRVGEDCTNGNDDNGDTLVDCQDPLCDSDPACFEDCDNNTDDNGDTLVDCGDPLCTGDAACAEDCTNGTDDNGDTLADCNDPLCTGRPVCAEDCTNGSDDNGNSLVDCDDPQCNGDAACLVTCNAGETLVRLSATDVPIAIPDNAAGTPSIIGVSGAPTSIRKVVVVIDSITHTFDADLDISLVSPTGTSVDLSSDNGGSGENYTSTMFSDGCPAIAGLGATSAPFTGCYGPEVALGSLAGQDPNGNWSLLVSDDAGQDVGTLDAWTLALCVTAPACPNGVVEVGEECDDNNGVDGDGCSSTCQIELNVCGNGITEGPEQCDDNNRNDGDGCSSACQIEPGECGNGIRRAWEECDDNNAVDGDGCSSLCVDERVSCDAGQTRLRVAATNLPRAISDNATVTSVISVADTGSAAKVVLILEDLRHTYDADLDISLISPAGTSLNISSDNGGSGDNYLGTVFQDGCPAVTGGTAPFSGCFSPEVPLAGLVGQTITGNWTLSIADDAGGDTGTLNAWTLGICLQ